MKQQYAVIVLFALVITSSLTSLDSYRTTNQMVCKDMDRALALALEELPFSACQTKDLLLYYGC